MGDELIKKYCVGKQVRVVFNTEDSESIEYTGELIDFDDDMFVIRDQDQDEIRLIDREGLVEIAAEDGDDEFDQEEEKEEEEEEEAEQTEESTDSESDSTDADQNQDKKGFFNKILGK